MLAIHAVLPILSAMLTLLAGPYRVIMYRFRTFGGVGAGLITWAGIFLAFPVFAVPRTSGDAAANRLFILSWLALIVWTYVQMFAKWCSGKPRRDEGTSHCWFGRWEPAAVLGLVIVSALAGSGLSSFLLYGYAASMAQIGLMRLRRRCDAWTPEDTAKIVTPLQQTAQRLQPVAIQGAGRAWFALRLGALSLIPFGAVLLRGLGMMFGKTAQASGGVVATPRPPTFMNRVFCHIVASLAISFVTGAIGFRAIFRCFSIVLAIPLWLAGWDMSPPDAMKDEARSVISRARDTIDDRKAEIEGRLEDGEEQLADEVERRKRRAAWRLLAR